MAEKVLMIALSPTMETGTLAKWRKKEGDKVSSGDVICEVETDKATMDYESSVEGTLLKIVLPEGGQAAVGKTIAIIGSPGEDISALVAEAEAEAKTAASMEGQAPAGAAVSAPAAAPAQAAAPSPAAAASAPQPAASAAAPVPVAAAPASLQAPASTPISGGRVKSSPLARRLAVERGVDLRLLRGSGPGGRVVRRDVESARVGAAAMAGATSGFAAAGPIAPAPMDQVIPLTNMRRTIARRMAESMYSAVHIYLTERIVMDGLLEARARLNAGRETKVSLNAFLIKLAAEALKRHPRVNSSWNTDSIILRGSIDIGIAVALPDGLIAPIVRNCGAKGILAIEGELVDLISRARSGKLKPEEYTGGGFAISNLGTFGIEEFTAVINPPASAILAVGAIRKEPLVEGPEDRITVRSVMRVTLSCDHRVVDGAVGAAFLADLRAMAEDPYRALY
jgi:pyruvate dehydrogenase E2 component (dihydrolipoamide acetyltransferase)